MGRRTSAVLRCNPQQASSNRRQDRSAMKQPGSGLEAEVLQTQLYKSCTLYCIVVVKHAASCTCQVLRVQRQAQLGGAQERVVSSGHVPRSNIAVTQHVGTQCSCYSAVTAVAFGACYVAPRLCCLQFCRQHCHAMHPVYS